MLANKDSPPPLITIEETLLELKQIGIEITPATLYNWCRLRGWGFRTPGGRWMVLRLKLEEYVNAASKASHRSIT